ncbi:hypothetical protein B296_00015325 [Ensete ventricosum]|uniref:Uncharacterized protein n=1 Tax=Ensete ventricosum TaxID=4639 RepID=A0A427A9I2_ENSVE|nr:hypothetical protein B296_00015325 [Ensete ventricosum]
MRPKAWVGIILSESEREREREHALDSFVGRRIDRVKREEGVVGIPSWETEQERKPGKESQGNGQMDGCKKKGSPEANPQDRSTTQSVIIEAGPWEGRTAHPLHVAPLPLWLVGGRLPLVYEHCISLVGSHVPSSKQAFCSLRDLVILYEVELAPLMASLLFMRVLVRLKYNVTPGQQVTPKPSHLSLAMAASSLVEVPIFFGRRTKTKSGFRSPPPPPKWHPLLCHGRLRTKSPLRAPIGNPRHEFIRIICGASRSPPPYSFSWDGNNPFGSVLETLTGAKWPSIAAVLLGALLTVADPSAASSWPRSAPSCAAVSSLFGAPTDVFQESDGSLLLIMVGSSLAAALMAGLLSGPLFGDDGSHLSLRVCYSLG